jgi:2-oxoglutarate ferredoxin oxidoreductase subunit gamma
MKQRYEFILAGSGGQGLVLAGRVLGEAAILEGRNVVQTQSALGDSRRGGLSVSEVIIDTEEIVFQQVQQPDLILVLSERAIAKYAQAAAGVPLLYDSSSMRLPEKEWLYPVPFAELVAKINPAAANLAALGLIVRRTGVVARESLEKAVKQRFSGDAARANLQAVTAGWEAPEVS